MIIYVGNAPYNSSETLHMNWCETKVLPLVLWLCSSEKSRYFCVYQLRDTFSMDAIYIVIPLLSLIFLAFAACGLWYMCCKRNPHEGDERGYTVAMSNRLFNVSYLILVYIIIYSLLLLINKWNDVAYSKS